MKKPRFIALELATELYQDCEKLKLKNPIRDQLHRAALSIALNLTEGSGRRTSKEKKHFFSVALGSTREVQTIVQIIGHQGLIQNYDRLGAMVYGLVRRF